MPEGGGLALAIDNADAGMPHINPAGFCSPLRKVIFYGPAAGDQAKGAMAAPSALRAFAADRSAAARYLRSFP
ncbi:hypothetical protein GCM10009413_07870 [Tatumella punctata]|uniref:hypothetical protein n=1 Tax=Tatumella punctata TaxID=399969 RepID=UPI0031E06B54